MKINRVYGVWFSPAGTTEQVVRSVTVSAAEMVGVVPVYIDLTLPSARKQDYTFGNGDLVIVGCPTYAGRVPNKVMPDLKAHLQGSGALCVPVVTYGNRSYDESLKELAVIMRDNGFTVVAGAAAVCRHAFSETLAAGRPDREDLKELAEFGKRVARRITEAAPRDVAARNQAALDILAGRDLTIGPYYVPKKEDGTPAKFLKAKSKADPGKCSRCMLCTAVCPMGSIDPADPFSVPGVCIKCQACVRKCPSRARFFDDPDFLSHVRMLEKTYQEWKEIVWTIGE